MSTTDHTSDPMGDDLASRGYRERAEKAEAKATRSAGLLGHQPRTLTDTIAAEALRQKAGSLAVM